MSSPAVGPRSAPVRPLVLGEEYQHRYFWLQSSRLFSGHQNVVRVAIELVEARSFDDVVVRYRVPILDDFGRGVGEDHFQLKFHLKDRQTITGADLIDPNFIGAAKVSLLERVRAALPPDAAAPRRRMNLVTTWTVDRSDPLSELVSNRSGELDVDLLLKAGPRSDLGKLREAWQARLGDTDDLGFRHVLEAVSIHPPMRMDQLDRELDRELLVAGLAPVDPTSVLHPYESISRGFVVDGQLEHDASGLDAVLKREKLRLREPLTANAGAQPLGIKSRSRFAAQLEDAADSLNLLPFFRGRKKLDDVSWDGDIAQAITSFLESRIASGGKYELCLDCHLSIAYFAGRCLGKVPADVAPGRGRDIWRPTGVAAEGRWKVREERLGEGPELAIGIEVTREVAADAALFLHRHMPAVGRMLVLTVADGVGDQSVRDADHAVALASEAGRLVAANRQDPDRGRPLHLFLSTPAPFALFLGKVGRAFGPTTTYEFDFESGVPGAYSPAFRIWHEG